MHWSVIYYFVISFYLYLFICDTVIFIDLFILKSNVEVQNAYVGY